MDLTDAGLRERAQALVTGWEKATVNALHGDVRRMYLDGMTAALVALRDTVRAEPREALDIYGSHLTGCLANEAIARQLFGNDRVDDGMPNGVGTYRDEHPDCTCGFSAAIRARALPTR